LGSGVSEDSAHFGFDCASAAGVDPLSQISFTIRCIVSCGFHPFCRSLSHAINSSSLRFSGVSRFASQNRNKVKPKPRPSHSQTGIIVIAGSQIAIGTANDAAIRNFLVMVTVSLNTEHA